MKVGSHGLIFRNIQSVINSCQLTIQIWQLQSIRASISKSPKCWVVGCFFHKVKKLSSFPNFRNQLQKLKKYQNRKIQQDFTILRLKSKILRDSTKKRFCMRFESEQCCKIVKSQDFAILLQILLTCANSVMFPHVEIVSISS